MQHPFEKALSRICPNPREGNKTDLTYAYLFGLQVVREARLSFLKQGFVETSQAQLCRSALSSLEKVGFPVAERIKKRSHHYRKAGGSIYWVISSARFALSEAQSKEMYVELKRRAEIGYRLQIDGCLARATLPYEFADCHQVLNEAGALLNPASRERLDRVSVQLLIQGDSFLHGIIDHALKVLK